MLSGAAATMLEDMRRAGKGRGTDPLQAFAAHRAECRGLELGYRERQDVTADAPARDRTLWCARRTVMRATRAEKRLSGREGDDLDAAADSLEAAQSCRDADRVGGQQGGERARAKVRVELHVGRTKRDHLPSRFPGAMQPLSTVKK